MSRPGRVHCAACLNSMPACVCTRPAACALGCGGSSPLLSQAGYDPPAPFLAPQVSLYHAL